MRGPIVLRPDVPFPQVAEALSALGFGRQKVHAVSKNASPGEPELAAWTRLGRAERLDTGRVVYTYNARVGLRVLALHGEAEAVEADLVGRLPTLGEGEVRELLVSEQPGRVLLGLLVADLLLLDGVRDLVGALCTHPSPGVASAAETICAKLDPDVN